MNNQLLLYIVFSVILQLRLGMENFAFHKYANQSTTLTYNGFKWTADKAVDGNIDGIHPDTSGTCSATIQSISAVNHTWEVDLGVNIFVKTIRVFGRSDGDIFQLDDVRLYLGNNSGPWNYGQEVRSDPLNSNGNDKYVFKPHTTIARFISLMRQGHILTICEVTVEGECIRGTYGSGCNEICGNCYKGYNSCSLTDGRCMERCEAGWRGDTCKLECQVGTYGFNCNGTCGNCLNGNNSCSKISGQCSGGCLTGWTGETCKAEISETATGAIVGSAIAAVGVSISAMLIIIVIVKKRKKDNNETTTDNVTPATHYVNVVLGNPDAAFKMTDLSRAEQENTLSAIDEESLQGGMKPDDPSHNVYEELRHVTESTESAYSTISQHLLNEQNMNTIETRRNYSETLQELESALKSIEEEISVLLDRKDKLLCKELERSRAIKLRDMRKETDYTYINDESNDALECCSKCVQMLQSLDGKLRMLDGKRKCLLGRKESLLRQKLVKTSKV